MNIKGSGSSTINSFTGGMVSDTDALSARNNTYYYAENARISQEGSIGAMSNIEEFIPISTLPSNAGRFISYYKVDKFTILVSIYNNNINVYKYFNDDNGVEQCIKVATLIDTAKPTSIGDIKYISINASIESNKIHRVYFADGVHGLFSINIYRDSVDYTDWDTTYDISKIQFLSSNYKTPVVKLSTSRSGSLLAGKYFYTIRYTSDSGSESNDIYVSGGVNATVDDSNGGIVDSETGKPSQTSTNINLSIDNIDDSAYGINIYRIYYYGSGIGYTASLIYSDKILRDINGDAYKLYISDISSESILSDFTDSILFNEPVKIASVIENKDNLLFAGNIKYSKNHNINYDVRAFSFNSNKEFDYRNNTESFGTNTNKLKFDFLNDEESVFGLAGKDDHDFINDDIYTKDRYRDVLYRYCITNNPDESIELTYGGVGKNVSYEFIHTYLIASEEGSIFTNKSTDSSWFKQSELTGGDLDINSSNSDVRNKSCKSLIDLNMTRDDLVIRYGDKNRDIDSITIEHQSGKTNSGVDRESISVGSFGILSHNGRLDYSNSLISNTLSGFKRNEIFRFAVKFKLNDGTETDPMWISDIRFPSNHIIHRKDSDDILSTTGRLFSFSSFVSPDDTKEGENIVDLLMDNSDDIVHNGFSQQYDHIGDNDLSRAELLVKPLGLKFKFNNVPNNVVSAKILYTPLNSIERTILGQFLVSRLGGFSNGGVEFSEENKYYESICDNFAYPHPLPSMKYTYGIGPMQITPSFSGSEYGNEYYNRSSTFNHRTRFSLGFDWYSGASSPVTLGTIPGSKEGVIDHDKANTNAISTSPYYSDINNYVFASPSISYVGYNYIELIKNLSGSIVFEDIVSSKNSKPWMFPHNSTHLKFYVIPSIGNNVTSKYDDVFARHIAVGNKNAYIISSTPNASKYNNILDFPWNSSTELFDMYDSILYGSLPTFMYTGAFLSKDERKLSSADKSAVYLSACGTTTHLILESIFWYKKDNVNGKRLSDSTFNLAVGHSYVNRYLSANRFRTGSLGVDSKNVKMPNGKYSDVSYLVGGDPSEFLIDSVNENNWKHYEKVWDDNGMPGSTGIKTNLPISLKTIMSGIAISSFKLTQSGALLNRWSHAVTYLSGYFDDYQLDTYTSYDDLNEKGRMGSFGGKYLSSNALTSSTFKYFKSSIPAKWYTQNSSDDKGLGFHDRYISFIKQNSNEFSDYKLMLSMKDGIRISDYNPINDNSIYSTNNPSGVWDMQSIPVNKMFYSGVRQSPTGPFDLSYATQLGQYNGYINYSKTLAQEMVGASQYKGESPAVDAIASFFSGVFNGKTGDITDDNDNSSFLTMNMIKRGRLSGKHGACAIVSVNDSIPMVGHMFNVDYKLDRILRSSVNDIYNHYVVDGDTSEADRMLNNTRLYWHMLDGACSAHTSTYLVDIRSKFNYLLQHSSLHEKNNSKYIEASQSINLGNTNDHKYYVFGGGTYVTLFDYTSTYANRSMPDSSYDLNQDSVANWNSVANSCQTARLNILIPIESDINTHIDSGCVNHKNFNSWTLETPTNGENSPNVGYSKTPIVFTQDIDESVYMDGYSAKKDFNQIQLNKSNDEIFNDYEYKSRIIGSEKKILGEQNDSWSIFKPVSYIDLNPSNGSINGLSTFSNRLYAIQDKSVSFISVNERSIITDSQAAGTQLLLGSGKVFEYSSIISDTFGVQENTMSLVKNGISGVFFYDNNNKSICRISSGVSNLSDTTFTNKITSSVSASNNSFILPWIKNNEVMFGFDSIDYLDYENSNILFEEKRGLFESFITHKINFGFEFGNDIRIIDDYYEDMQTISKPTDKTVSDMAVFFTVNESITQTKIFDSVDVNLSWTHWHTTDNNTTEISTSYSNSVASTGIFKTITSVDMNRQNKEASIHAAIHRVDGQLTRMRDKYIRSMYKFVGGVEISLPYIKTNYRYSAI